MRNLNGQKRTIRTKKSNQKFPIERDPPGNKLGRPPGNYQASPFLRLILHFARFFCFELNFAGSRDRTDGVGAGGGGGRWDVRHWS